VQNFCLFTAASGQPDPLNPPLITLRNINLHYFYFAKVQNRPFPPIFLHFFCVKIFVTKTKNTFRNLPHCCLFYFIFNRASRP